LPPLKDWKKIGDKYKIYSYANNNFSYLITIDSNVEIQVKSNIYYTSNWYSVGKFPTIKEAKIRLDYINSVLENIRKENDKESIKQFLE